MTHQALMIGVDCRTNRDRVLNKTLNVGLRKAMNLPLKQSSSFLNQMMINAKKVKCHCQQRIT